MSVTISSILVMAKTINLMFEGDESIFTFKPIDRASLYGKRRRVAFDAEGNECSRASLLRDGSLLIRSGMTAQGYFTSAGNWVPQAEIEAINPDGSVPTLYPATTGIAVDIQEITAEQALNLKFVNTYQLEPETLSAKLKEQLDEGKLFGFPFNPRADYQMETGILVSNENGYFALIGEEVAYEFASLASIITVTEEADSEMSDDLDFEMF
jgi:hypothetical protein